jgi:hypothetical protein
MTREHTVSVKLREGAGEVNLVIGEKYALRLAPGEVAEKWASGAPITRAEFHAVLERERLFEIAEEFPPEEEEPKPVNE